MTFTEHLRELRSRIIRSLLAVAVGFFICYGFSNTVFYIVARPLHPFSEAGVLSDATWTTLNPLEGFLVKLKLAAYAGLILALPYVFYQLCAFVFPGLTSREKRMAWVLIGGCSILALGGAAVAYFGVFPLVLPYLLQWTPKGVQVQLRMSETVSLLLKGFLGFAVAFQFPMVVLTLVSLGVLNPSTLRRYRRFAIVAIAIISALFTPPDVLSMVIMMAPLILLFEISVWLSYVVARKRKASAETEESPEP